MWLDWPIRAHQHSTEDTYAWGGCWGSSRTSPLGRGWCWGWHAATSVQTRKSRRQLGGWWQSFPLPGGRGRWQATQHTQWVAVTSAQMNFTPNKECLSSVEHRRGRCYLSPDHSHKSLLYRTSSCTLTVVHTTALDI